MSNPIAACEQVLLARQSDGGGFPYHMHGMSFADATAWSALALSPAHRAETGRALDFLARCERDGGYAAFPDDAEPAWMTSPALLALARLDPGPRTDRARSFMLDRFHAQSQPGKAAPGWPWTGDCAPWVEPTALALIALAHAGAADHPRVAAGLKMIADNEAHGGGWSLYARHPHVYHTGLVLLAVHSLRAAAKDPSKLPEPSKDSLDRARRFLEDAAPRSAALLDLAVAALALVAPSPAPTAPASAAATLLADRVRSAGDRADTLAAAFSLIALRQAAGDPLLHTAVKR